jgi:IPT/TIG domain
MRIISRLALSSCFIVIIIAANLSRAQSPQITSVSPAEAFVGTQVSIAGTGFGNSQGSGVVWLGTAKGVVVSWSDTQVIAAVATGSSSGRAQIQQSGMSSNPVDFIVDTATVNSVSPSSAAPGTQVTISGVGFHAVQGSGQLWLGTAMGQVNSWSETQIVATVAANSSSGYISVIQDGLWSNFIDFTVLGPPHITQIDPKSGPVGTTVTISGSGFGSTQSGGQVWIGGTSANVTQWSDTSIQATVANNAVSGVAKVQNNAWSNNIAFRVTTDGAGSMPSLILVPDTISMVVGDTRGLQALDSNSQPVTGLSWSSSDATIATLSTDDPPIITAVAPGNVTIYAGAASADITVYPGPTLPIGTVQWSYAEDGSGCCGQIYPAVPSETGVADVFVQNASFKVQAVRSDGTVAWTTPIDWHYSIVPDFQGGFVAFSPMSLFRVDGLTGQAYPSYTASTSFDQALGNPIRNVAIHTDGTIFTLDYACSLDDCGENDPTTNSWVVGIDPLTGRTKFKAAAVNSNSSYSYNSPSGLCPRGSGQGQSFPWLSYPIIAGDGFAYTSYITQDTTETMTDPPFPQPYTAAEYALVAQLGADILHPSAALADLSAMSQTLEDIFSDVFYDEEGGNTTWAQRDFVRAASGLGPYCDSTESGTEKLHLLRVGSDGSSTDMIVKQWSWQRTVTQGRDPSNVYSFTETESRPPYITHQQMQGMINAITNADTGVLLSWKTDEFNYCATLTDLGCASQFQKPAEYHLTTTNGAAIAQDATMMEIAPNQTGPIQPVLQLQDGTFVGTTNAGGSYTWTGQYMAKFDSSGNVAGVQSGYGPPQMATADGGVVTQDGTFFDSNLAVKSAVWSLPTYSWFNNAYSGPQGLTSLISQGVSYAPVFNAVAGGNRSQNGTATQEEWFPELASCPLAPPGQPPCSKEAIRHALASLRQKLSAPCATCSSLVFNLVGIDQSSLLKFLQLPPRLFDGTKSNLPRKQLCGLASGLEGISKWADCRFNGVTSGKVSDYMASAGDKGASSAMSQTPSDKGEGLMIFFDPRIICNVTDGSAKEMLNESLLFHESLHGSTGIQDVALENAFQEVDNPGITYYLENNIVGGQLIYLHDVSTDPEPMQCPQ